MSKNPSGFVLVSLVLSGATDVRGQCGECLQWSSESAPAVFINGAYHELDGVSIAMGNDGELYVETDGNWYASGAHCAFSKTAEFWQRLTYVQSPPAIYAYLVGSMQKITHVKDDPDEPIFTNNLAANPWALYGSSVCEFDPRSSLLIFGGEDVPKGVQNLLIEFDPATQTYEELMTDNAPTPRSHAAMAYDPIRQRVVLFGGTTDYGSSSSMSDTWEYDGEDWVQIVPVDGVGPIPRHASTLAYDSGRQVMVLVGGRSGNTHLHDTWEWDGVRWTPRFPGPSHTVSTPTRALAFVAHEGTMINFNGSNQVYKLSGVAPAPPDIDPPAAPLIQLQLGDSTLLAVSASSDPPQPLAYQWRKNGMDIADAKSPSLALIQVTETDAGEYECVVRYEGSFDFDCGSAISGPIEVVVLPPTCRAFDADSNGAVNLRDFALFQQRFGQSCE